MEIKEIQDLIKFVAKSGVSEVELESKGFKIVIKTGSDQSRIEHPTYVQAVAAPVAQPIAIAQTPTAPTKAEPVTNNETKYITIKSPMIGTFYRAAGADKPPFISIGDEVVSGKVVCIIEAMKLFNEIESEISGKVVKVLIDDATPVEYDQPLFLIDPS